MKLSVSLPEEDVEFLDAYARSEGIGSRSAVVHKAVGLLRTSELGDAYEEAFTSWSGDEQAVVWDLVAADGLET